MTELLFRQDPYLLDFEARIVDRRQHEGRPAVVLDRTAFYYECGGQPWDTGTLEGTAVLAVVEEKGEVLHVLASPLPAGRVHGRVDGERRADHRQQHHGQHLLSRAFVERASARTLSFHLGERYCSIDLHRPVDDTWVKASERRANEVVWQDRPVTVKNVGRAEAQALGVEAPEEAGSEIRLVEVQDYEVQACSGTHPRRTGEVGVILVLGHERYKAGSRVRFVCGFRALDAARESRTALDRMSGLLSAAPDAMPAAVERLQAELLEARREGRGLLERLVASETQRLVGDSPDGGIVTAVYDGWAAEELRALAAGVVAAGPWLALLGSRADRVHVVFAQSEGLGHDVVGLLQASLGRLGGRGGGRGNLAQGSSDRAAGLEEALAAAAQSAASQRRLVTP